ncbi:MAG: hypothetical protein HDS72_00065 [Bacteroidales bacterium]|nr:hypothetical protein [Bacteroidales bacterium]
MNTEFYNWIDQHMADDPARLRLKFAGKQVPGVDVAAAIVQIECRRKFGTKLAQTLASFPQFYFPSTLAGEQSTSDLLARYHASLVPEGLAAADLTAGLGIDALHFAARASSVVAVERNKELTDALRFNADGLHVENLEIVNGDCRDFVDRCIAEGRRFGAVFIDPARRAADGSRVFALADCEPDVVAMLPKLKQICRLLVIKASPMLDITHTIGELSPAPLSVMAVGTPTECKELMMLIDFGAEAPYSTMIEAVTLTADGAETFAFTADAERNAEMPATAPLAEGNYIYEPSPCLMKTGAFRLVADRYGLRTFQPNTRLFHSPEKIDNFPGTCWRVVKIFPYASRVIKRFAREYPAVNVAVRNFGMSADALRARLGVRDAGPLRLYGLTDSRDEKLLVLTEPA